MGSERHDWRTTAASKDRQRHKTGAYSVSQTDRIEIESVPKNDKAILVFDKNWGFAWLAGRQPDADLLVPPI
jgi:hypothetical protein